MLELEKLLQEREQLLSEHPELRVLQNEIDEMLSGVIAPEDRLEIVNTLLQCKLTELSKAFADLYNVLCGLMEK